jgi:6-phosphogluconolactonase
MNDLMASMSALPRALSISDLEVRNDEPTMTSRRRVYVGCSTHASPIGIHIFELDDDERAPALTERGTVAGVDHPTFLAVHPTREVLYAVSETERGEIVSFQVDRTDGTLAEWQRVSSEGDGPCHLSTDGEHIYVANYRSGSASAHALLPDGRISDLVWSVRHRGRGPHVRQEAPHIHCAIHDPHRTSVHVVDLGTDCVARYDADPTTSGYRSAAELAFPPGSGPRHLSFHPDLAIAFAVCELANTLVVLDVDESTGELVPRQTISTLPDDFVGDSLAAAVRVHPDGHRVYVSNRGHDSIATFAVGGPGEPLIAIGHVASGGNSPRDVAIDPAGTLLLVANQRSGDIAGFAVDDPTGLPRPLGVLAQVQQPACILITEVHR